MPAPLKLGISTSIFSGPLSLRECELCTQCGVEAVEIGYEQASPALEEEALQERLAVLVQEAGLPVAALHAPYRPERDLSLLDEVQRARAVQRAEEALALARRLGTSLIVLHASEDPLPTGQRAQRREQARRSLEHLQGAARRLGLRLAVETMPLEWIPAGLEEVLELVEGLDPEVVGCCLDTNHSNLNGELDEFASALGRRLWHVHLSDNDGRQQRHWMPTRGVIDWGAFLGALGGLREIEENFAQLKKLL